MLDIKGVKKSYGEFQLDCSLNVEKGRITGLVGENGAGKSTMMKLLYGMYPFDEGEVLINGKTYESIKETKQCFEESFQVSDFYDRQTQDS